MSTSETTEITPAASTIGATIITGKDEIKRYQMVTLAVGLEMYAKTGILPNRLWTPRNMMRTAEQLTGKKFRAREYIKAANVLRQLIDKHSRGEA